MANSNQYKEIFNNFINNFDPKSPDQVYSINEKFCNAFKSENSLANLSKRDGLDKNILDKLSQLALRSRNLQVY